MRRKEFLCGDLRPTSHWAIFLDFGGIIIDTETAYYECWTEAYRRLGCALPQPAYANAAGTATGFDPIEELRTQAGYPVDRERRGRPVILHWDQVSEYKINAYTSFAENIGVKLSMSHKHSPWENGYQESFYSQFKADLGNPNCFEALGELAVAIYLRIHYYNTARIHTKLRVPPTTLAAQQVVINPVNPPFACSQRVLKSGYTVHPLGCTKMPHGPKGQYMRL